MLRAFFSGHVYCLFWRIWTYSLHYLVDWLQLFVRTKVLRYYVRSLVPFSVHFGSGLLCYLRRFRLFNCTEMLIRLLGLCLPVISGSWCIRVVYNFNCIQAFFEGFIMSFLVTVFFLVGTDFCAFTCSLFKCTFSISVSLSWVTLITVNLMSLWVIFDKIATFFNASTFFSNFFFVEHPRWCVI